MNETDFHGIGKAPTTTPPDGRPAYEPKAVRRIQVGQARRRVMAPLLLDATREACDFLIDQRQAAGLRNRSGVKHIAELQVGLRYWATQAGHTSGAGLRVWEIC